jgi:hypothetical protein
MASKKRAAVPVEYRVDSAAQLVIDQTLGTWVNNVLVTIALAFTIFIAGITLYYLQALASAGDHVHQGLGVTLMALAFVAGAVALVFIVFCIHVHHRRKRLFTKGRVDFQEDSGYSYAWIYGGLGALGVVMVVAMVVLVWAASIINQ